MLFAPCSKALSIKLNKDSRKLNLSRNGFMNPEAKLQRGALSPNFPQHMILKKTR
jgi:hypothetical protein